MIYSRVHISKCTLAELGGDYQVEAANPERRDSFLRERNMDTFLIVTDLDPDPDSNENSKPPVSRPKLLLEKKQSQQTRCA